MSEYNNKFSEDISKLTNFLIDDQKRIIEIISNIDFSFIKDINDQINANTESIINSIKIITDITAINSSIFSDMIKEFDFTKIEYLNHSELDNSQKIEVSEHASNQLYDVIDKLQKIIDNTATPVERKPILTFERIVALITILLMLLDYFDSRPESIGITNTVICESQECLNYLETITNEYEYTIETFEED